MFASGGKPPPVRVSLTSGLDIYVPVGEQTFRSSATGQVKGKALGAVRKKRAEASRKC
jgi:hypothetical protein